MQYYFLLDICTFKCRTKTILRIGQATCDNNNLGVKMCSDFESSTNGMNGNEGDAAEPTGNLSATIDGDTGRIAFCSRLPFFDFRFSFRKCTLLLRTGDDNEGLIPYTIGKSKHSTFYTSRYKRLLYPFYTLLYLQASL